MQVQGQIHISPEVFSPDNDGMDDFTFINYQLSEPNYVANISIFDVSGRMVKALVKNATLSATGSFRWDGLNDLQQRPSVGSYIIVTEIFNLKGKTKRFKNVVTVARRF
jgi:flagellar hook assembly protein FlgD